MKTIELDYTKQCGDEPDKGHNRWHPDIPPAVAADPGEEVVMQTRNAFDMQINPSTQAADLLNTDLGLGASPHRAGLRERRGAGRSAGDQHPEHRTRQAGGSPPSCPASASCATCTPSRTSSTGRCATVSPKRSSFPACGFPKPRSWAPSALLRRGRCARRYCCGRKSCCAGAARWSGPRRPGAVPGPRTLRHRGAAHHPAPRTRRQRGHKAADRRHPADAAGVYRRRTVFRR